MTSSTSRRLARPVSGSWSARWRSSDSRLSRAAIWRRRPSTSHDVTSAAIPRTNAVTSQRTSGEKLALSVGATASVTRRPRGARRGAPAAPRLPKKYALMQHDPDEHRREQRRGDSGEVHADADQEAAEPDRGVEHPLGERPRPPQQCDPGRGRDGDDARRDRARPETSDAGRRSRGRPAVAPHRNRMPATRASRCWSFRASPGSGNAVMKILFTTSSYRQEPARTFASRQHLPDTGYSGCR